MTLFTHHLIGDDATEAELAILTADELEALS